MNTLDPQQSITFTDPKIYSCPFSAYDRLREEQTRRRRRLWRSA